MISQIKAATDIQIKRSMPLKRNKFLELISKSLKKLFFSMTFNDFVKKFGAKLIIKCAREQNIRFILNFTLD